MRRRAFLINSSIILLLIPLMLLLATYENVSYQVVHAQSERMQLGNTFDVISYLELDFQKALDISGKRAIVAVVDYVAVTGNFIDPAYKVNNTIRDLIVNGTSPSIPNYPALTNFIGNQDIKSWISNVSAELKSQGFSMEPNATVIADEIEITVAPLDSFRVVVKARIPNITVRSRNGYVVYSGSLPRTGWAYSIIDLRNLEDPMFSAYTGGRYQRSLRACQVPFPQLFDKPLKVLEGNGSSSQSYVVGELSTTVASDMIYFGDSYPGSGAEAYVLANETTGITAPVIFNTTLNGKRTSPTDVFADRDMGVLVFENVSSGSGSWCYPDLDYRVNFTLSGGSLTNYNGYQIPVVITDTNILSKIYNVDNNASIRIVEKGTCNEVPFWIEYWSSTKAIIWIKATTAMEYTMYFGNYTSYATRGNGNNVFEWFNGAEETVSDNNQIQFDLRTLGIDGDIAIRFRAGPSSSNLNDEWDSGIYVETTDSNGNPQWVYFIDDTVDTSNSLEVWDEYYILWWFFWIRVQGPSTNDGARGDTYLHTYETVIEPNLNGAYVDFLDYGTDYSSYPNPIRENSDGVLRHYTAPLEYLYLVNFRNNNNNDEIVKWIFIRKYIQTLPTETFSAIEQKPAQTTVSLTPARAYDIQPFIDCIQDNRYFGIYGGWSFFERLEGNNTNHNAYVTLAHQMQDELGVKYGTQYYPIGLVSFMVPGPAPYDQTLLTLLGTIGISTSDLNSDQESSVDYYFLQKYFGSASTVPGYRVYGISDSPDRDEVYFFLDNQTAEAVFGSQGAQDLLQR